ncbi:serine protease [Streptomyces filamentosus]|uniref:serine protease n=1 Tax=Streptomyces filamentosus TaxID=67294 RepID=UPI00123B0D18|nr:serine protease [Streptomyces filamentosus]KAA6210985.1 serine protease [Streptomyces filamentosus]
MNVYAESSSPSASAPSSDASPRAATRRTVLRGLGAVTAAGTAAVCLPAAAAHAAPRATAGATPDAAGTHALTLVHLGRDGAPTTAYRTLLTALSGPDAGSGREVKDSPGTVTLQVPAGRYMLDSTFSTRPVGEEDWGNDWLVRPRLDVDRDTTLVLDARVARPVDVRPPFADAVFEQAGLFAEVTYEGVTGFANLMARSPDLRVAHLGPDTERGAVRTWADSYWKRPAGVCALGYLFRGERAPTGLVRRPAAGDLATLVVRAGVPASGAGTGAGLVDFTPSPGPSPAVPLAVPFGSTGTFHFTAERGTWDLVYSVPSETEGPSNSHFVLGRSYAPGSTTVHTFDTPVHGPALDPSPGARPVAQRTGDTLDLTVPLLADGDGHVPSSPPFTASTVTLHRNGALLATRRGETPGHASFTLPAGRASYRLTASATRPRGSVTATWTFTSAATATATELPLSAVRFGPDLALDGTAPAHTPTRVAVTVQGAARRVGVRSLTVSVSTDGGTTWTPAPLAAGRIELTTPAPGRTVSLRAELTDRDGNTLTQTHRDAYVTRAATATR